MDRSCDRVVRLRSTYRYTQRNTMRESAHPQPRNQVEGPEADDEQGGDALHDVPPAHAEKYRLVKSITLGVIVNQAYYSMS